MLTFLQSLRNGNKSPDTLGERVAAEVIQSEVILFTSAICTEVQRFYLFIYFVPSPYNSDIWVLRKSLTK